MSTKPALSGRAAKLENLFYSFIKGDRSVQNSQEAKQFFEAVDVVCEHTSAVACIEHIIGEKEGLNTVRVAIRSNLSRAFITTATTAFLKRVLHHDVKTMNDGLFLEKLLVEILSPSTFWTTFLGFYQCSQLEGDTLVAFASLCLEIVSSSSPDIQILSHDVESLMKSSPLTKSPLEEVRTLGYRIEKVIQLRKGQATASVKMNYSPGGRHDNDFEDFRKISIYPTADEVSSKEEPFLQRLDDVFEIPRESRTSSYISWLFRLLREDMLADLREDLQIAWGQKKAKYKPLCLRGLSLDSYDLGDYRRAKPFTLMVQCREGINFPQNKRSPEAKKKYLEEYKNLVKHSAIGALCLEKDIIAFGSIVRDVNELIKDPPVVGIQVTDNAGLKLAVKALQNPDVSRLRFYVVDTATFSYEPILQRLKEVTEIPIENAILDPAGPPSTYDPPPRLRAFIRELKNCHQKGLGADLDPKLGFKSTIHIRDAQLESLIKGLENPVGQIQGPPGTGKSFIGAIIAKLLMELTEYRILVLSYTNHALDQFLEDLMDRGIDGGNMVRMGSKATARTDALRIDNLPRSPQDRSSNDNRAMKGALRSEQLQTAARLDNLIQSLKSQVPLQEILDMLEFSDSGMRYWSAFQVPDGDQIAGKKNKALKPVDVFDRWLNGKNLGSLGMLAAHIDPEDYPIWNIPPERRQTLYNEWANQVRQEQVNDFAQLAETANNLYRQIDSLFKESKRNVVKNRRIIGCTTTGAAMYQSIIRAASPDIVLVEEAGEILEAHVITSLSPSVKQLILIGDHKQLRPKVNNYNLTVEKGEGFDLNVSLFERLIRQGHRFAVLQEQFRSHPDISQFARLLAYPELKDVPKTHNHKPIRGVQKRVVFVHHEHPEEQLNNVSDRRDPTSKASKKNAFEAEMVLKTVKYLSQQGYKSEDMVVLTPYMGQLALLRQTLSEINDPYLNELDTHDLVRAGLMTQAASKAAKAKLRLSTVDNYQGEESDIVIISMARSNKNGDIGFLVACERLVVLMSRARKGIILYGNMNTFLASKKGGELWKKYFDTMKEKGFLFDGLPVHCEQHPDRASVLQKPQDFDQHCPDGGCAESCGAVLGCGKHTCERRCHRLTDHSQVPCTKMMKKTCERGHNIKYPCGKENQGCKSCAKEDEEMRRRVQRDLDMEKKRQERQDRYQRDLQEMDDEIDHHRRIMKYEQEEADQAKELAEKKSHLESLKQTKARMEASKSAASKQKNANDKEQEKSQQKQPSTNYADLDLPAQEWEDMKRDDGARNDALDDLMGLIGLESVKREFLSVKTNVDIKIRQGVALSDTRLSCSLLGNPGTGKTTVARIWGKFLTGIGAIPGDCFKETTGSKLANMGVKGCEDLLEQIKEDGGGVLFIDEAYQLSSGNSPGGKAVLDYLLAEVENLRGKVVFVLAGYSKQMESFFAHNPGFPSRFPITMNFEDYTDEELLRILKRQVNRKYNNQMEIEDGPDGLYFRIAARRIGRGRGKEGFGNARSIENCLARIEKRQANRIRLERRAKKSSNDFLFIKEDIIGPEPSLSLKSCKAWKKMNEMIGLKEVKEQVKILLDSLTTNYERELAEEPPMEFTLNRVFLGSPGTGKTTVAKLYGEILGALGLLSNGELVVKTPADFIGSALGQSESQTKGILASTIGKVLVIDEAYGLYGGKGVTDPYKTSVVDTIVAEVQNVPGDDRCVILIGYQEQMEEMFQNVNPGLSRRFSVDTPFVFEDFDDDGLRQVLDLKLKDSGFTTTGEGKTAALDVLIRERNRPHFGNGGAVTNLLSKAKASYQKRYSAGKIKKRNQLEAEDFDEDFDRSTRTETNVKQLFQDDIGREEIIQKLENIQSRVRQLKALGMDVKEEIPFNFLFRGPPGTGKTTTARKMGKVYYDMGFLSKATVEECSATDLIAEYVGQTGPKVQKVLEKSLGRVLLIDEAYRFAGSGFAQEAIDELVGLMTTPKYQGKLIIILAGYEHDINRLLSVNAGLTSRFPESIEFKPLEPDACFRLLADLLRKRKMEISKRGKSMDINCLENPSALFLSDCTTILAELSKADGWASARDVKQLARNVFQTVNLALPSLKLEEKRVVQELNRMLRDRQSRINKSDSPVPIDDEAASSSVPSAPSRTSTSTQAQHSTTVDVRNDTEEPSEEASKEPESPDDEESRRVVRDAGVSDELWEQLQKDQAKEARKKAEYRDLLEARKSAEAARKKIVQELLKEQKLKEEGERLKLEEAKKKAEAAREKILRQLIEQEERRKKEVAKQAKIRALGICPAGFNWIKQNGGYRCSGGSHFLSDAEIDRHMQ